METNLVKYLRARRPIIWVNSGDYKEIDTIVKEATKDYQDKAIEDEVFARLVHHPRVMYSPHIAYFTDEAIKNLVEGALNAAVEVITTGTSKSRVN